MVSKEAGKLPFPFFLLFRNHGANQLDPILATILQERPLLPLTAGGVRKL